ncbi:MAG: CDGSH iron-sulfur domain-containing protein [Phycisphaerales bacterium]|nr:CDGSH iron-sulfur domain-containing protein [Phycisphaerales bacterium]
MPRLLLISRPGPYKIEPKDFPTGGKSIWICGCGLSRNMPYCDQTHKTTCATEEPGRCYRYDPVTQERSETQERTDPPTPRPT